jgi:hypothetical protein
VNRSPYRSHPCQPAGPASAEGGENYDTELIPAFAIPWIGAVVRVACGVVRHEALGAEMVAATIAIFVLPYMLRAALVDVWASIKKV